MPTELLPLIYAAPNEGWTPFLEALRLRLRAAQTLLTLVDHRAGMLQATIHTAGVTEEQAAEYRANWVDKDPWATRVGARPYLGEMRASHEICPDEVLESLPVYQQFLSRHGWHYGGGLVVAADAGLDGVLSLARPKAEGKLTEEECQLLRELQPHVTSVIGIELRLRGLELIASFSERLPYGVALLDHQNKVVHSNKLAQQLLPQLKLDSLESRYLADQKTWLIARRFEGPPPGTELILLQPSEHWELEPGQLTALFGLTPAETRVTVLLCGGRTLSEVAAELGTSFETVRTHLKRVLAKTHCRRQAELVALVLRLVKA